MYSKWNTSVAKIEKESINLYMQAYIFENSSVKTSSEDTG